MSAISAPSGRELLVPDAEVLPGRQGARADLERWLQQAISPITPLRPRGLRCDILYPPLPAEETRPKPRREEDDRPSPRLLFYLGREDKPEELAANVTRLFLGVRLECAPVPRPPARQVETRRLLEPEAAFFTGLARQGRRCGRPRASWPHGTLPASSTAPFRPRRRPAARRLADWVTSAKNPYFPRGPPSTACGAHLFGVGPVDPADDMTPENRPSHPGVARRVGRSLCHRPP